MFNHLEFIDPGKPFDWDDPGLALNGEVGKYLNSSNRTVYAFHNQGLVAKVEWSRDPWQSKTEVEFLTQMVEDRHKRYFADVIHHGMLLDCVDAAPEGTRSGSYFIIEPLYEFTHPRHTTCDTAIMANRLANHYRIGDWFSEQWGDIDGSPIIYDCGHMRAAPTNYTFCDACNTTHVQSTLPLED